MSLKALQTLRHRPKYRTAEKIRELTNYPKRKKKTEATVQTGVSGIGGT